MSKGKYKKLKLEESVHSKDKIFGFGIHFEPRCKICISLVKKVKRHFSKFSLKRHKKKHEFKF